MSITSERISMEPLTPSLARRILARDERPGDAWHPEYPLADELGPLRNLAASPADASGFTMYLIRRNSDGLAVGGFGFFGPPDADGCVEFGYGLVPAARGAGLATEAVQAALVFAGANGASRARADTTIANTESQRVLEKAGLSESRRTDSTIYYERELSAR
ncbi:MULTISPECIES: GNAT family N-acetyltransferase [unclassified Leifsonia]|uniref:GNAT family N-acetyltransferase n=1 Tax=unclassified Leifsonia TaxID=2663824 RepID=UPI0006FA37EA|nr:MULTISPECIES: GNAT family N-acetyltransferase [unclassified Leifsonia]KQX07678.1 ribosomal protein N-acetylase [Leifsonia sp. Root1293]KRA11960.1 ribosomal protein N-acetylase [Leifsonia sp. Root60]